MARVETSLGAVDLGLFDTNDMVNLALQRTETLLDTGVRKLRTPSFSVWRKYGSDSVLRVEVTLRRRQILKQVARDIAAEAEEIRDAFGDFSPKSICDIGCGYALHELMFSRLFALERVLLIDIEHTEAKHHDYHETGAGYSNLAKAVTLFEANAGAAPPAVTAVNPNVTPVPMDRTFDFILSIKSCGFHYPVALYAEFFERCLAPGGRILLDLCNGEDHSAVTDKFRQVCRLPSTCMGAGHERVILERR